MCLLTTEQTVVFCGVPSAKQPAVPCRGTSKWRLPQLLEESENLSHRTIQEKCYILLLPVYNLNPATTDLSLKNAKGNI